MRVLFSWIWVGWWLWAVGASIALAYLVDSLSEPWWREVEDE